MMDNSCSLDRGAGSNLSRDDILNLNTYDFMAYLGKRVINPGGLAGRDLILEKLAPRPGSRLLEIGCGTGHTACHIARRYGCSVIAVDISPPMIREAQKTVARHGLERLVECRLGEIGNLPFEDESFDHVVAQAVLMFVDQPAALAEIHRVLRPGGVFGGLEFSWKAIPPTVIRDATYLICGCSTLDFHTASGWQRQLHSSALQDTSAVEQPFMMLSPKGFLRDEGLANSCAIAMKLLKSAAARRRMRQIWGHFSRHSDFFSYAVLSGKKSGFA